MIFYYLNLFIVFVCDLSFIIYLGEKVVIIGRIGLGKIMFECLIMGLYKLIEGYV